MKIQCSTCSARYSVSNEKVAGRQFKVRCKKCGDSMIVRGLEAIWHVSIDGEQEGPFTMDALTEHLAEHTEAFVWHEGLENWIAAVEVAELAHLFSENETATDLFAPSGGDAFSGNDEAANPPALASSLTGARNESSVLFSLSNLSALSGDTAPAAASENVSTTDGSGLIDIRRLAMAIEATPEPANEETVDELLSFGGSDLGNPLGAPVLMPEPESPTSRRPIMIGSAFAALVAIAAGVVVAVVQLDTPTPEARNDETLVDERDELVDAILPGAIAHQPSTPQAPSAPSVVATPDGEPDALPDAETETETETAPQARRPRPRNPRPRPPRVDPTHEEPVEEPVTTTDDPIGDIFAPRRPPPREPANNLPERPSRADVTGAMSAITPAVRACADGSHGMAVVNASFGSNGSVRSVNVSGSLAGPVRSCVARVVRGAHLPEFSSSSFRVNYPFRL